jgi:hypothetical protein
MNQSVIFAKQAILQKNKGNITDNLKGGLC